MKNLLSQVSGKLNQTTKTSTNHMAGKQVPPSMTASDGTVAIHNGIVTVKDPLGNGSYAILSIPEADCLTVAIDGLPASGDIVVNHSQQIFVRLKSQQPAIEYEPVISFDKVSVLIRVTVTIGRERRLKDAEPCARLSIAWDEIQTQPRFLQPQELIDKLHEWGFKGDIDYDAIFDLCMVRQSAERVVLRGKAPVHQNPSRFTSLLEGKETDPSLGRTLLPMVATGQPIAEKQPSPPAEPGVDIHGKEIPLPPGANGELILGKGVLEKDKRVFAIISGRPLLTKHKIDVIPQLELSTDLTGKENKIVFDGDVVIRGSVFDDAHIQSGGSVTISGSVLHSTIEAESSILIGGQILGSRVQTGVTQALYAHLSQRVKILQEHLNRFAMEYEELLAAAKQRGAADRILSLIPRTLIEQRHHLLQKEIHSHVISNERVFESILVYQQLAYILRTKWANPSYLDKEDVAIVQRLCQNAIDEILRLKLPNAPVIRLATASTSNISSEGHIIVTGTGTVASNMESKRSLTVNGVVHGGFLMAGNKIRIREAGNDRQVETSIRVDNPDGMIVIQKAHPNTLLQLGEFRKKLEIIEKNIRLRRER